MVGQWMGKARKMAAEFQGQFQEAMREAEMADLKKSFDEVKEAATGLSPSNLMTSLQKDVGDALRIDDIDKPLIDKPVTDNNPVDAQIASAIGEPVTPIGEPVTPAAPTPETFVEAEAHDGRGNPYFWIGFERAAMMDTPAEGTDLAALAAHYVSVTPLRLDRTDEAFSEALTTTLR